ncbi:MAG: DUF4965 domain-containing protein, partial [Spartobacteria bacterium]|nr:DUF4965 domain-containing protein [Spartobacteria bacterium]
IGAPPIEAGLKDAVKLRPPAVPLVTHDPYFSIWSQGDKLTDVNTTHWTGRPHRLTGLVRIDGKAFRVMGAEPAGAPALEQKSLTVLPTRTIYTFEGAGVALTLTFLTPTLPEDIDILSRPVTYVDYEFRSIDDKNHTAALYLDASAEIAVNSSNQTVEFQTENFPGFSTVRIGSKDQPVLAKKGDDIRIDWGYLYLSAPASGDTSASLLPASSARQSFLSGEALPKVKVDGPLPAVDAPAAMIVIDSINVSSKPVSRWLMIAYDDLYSIQYMKKNLRPYWRRNGWEAADLLKAAANDYESLQRRCVEFDDELMADLTAAGGEKYAKLCALAYRQCFAAGKFVADDQGKPIQFCKENHSNGCIGTSDVFYPMAPQFLIFGPSLTKSFLVPFMDYAASDRWKFPFAPHDLGQYPHANGQVYGDGEKGLNNQMPVEESANLLCLFGAVAQMEGNADFAGLYWPQLEKWAAYLKEKGYDPENQLCTDDFAGHLAHNVNLSGKAICGLGAFAKLCEMRGEKACSEEYFALARESAQRWIKEADDGDHFRLAFDKPGTWSQKYNLIWDRILGLNLFPAAALQKEMDFYKKHQNKYGLPLDSRKNYTILMWTAWTATLTQNRADFDALIDPIFTFMNETPDRSPLTDWYQTETARKVGFTARPVIGGVFAQMLYNKPVWKKYADRDRTKAANWAPMPSPVTYGQASASHVNTGDTLDALHNEKVPTAFSAPPAPAVKPLPYGAVTLLDGSLKEHQDLDIKVLLEMSPDRFLSLFRKEAGLTAKAGPYGGWELTGVAGQTGGHYLTALCLMWKATGNAEIKRRIDYMVDELAECQQANGNGYVAAIPGGKKIFADVKAGLPLKGWVPWYTLHKLLAGLRDAYALAGNAKAREVWIRLSDFCCDTIAPLTDEQMQRMLDIEHGGMTEVMADLFAVTGDAKYLAAAKRFCHHKIFDPMVEGRDVLTGFHANTQIAKLIGYERIHELTGEDSFHKAARFFWETVVENRSWITGGNSDREHFFAAETSAGHIDSHQTAETCNVYNMLRLTRALYAQEPKASYLDYYERALYNQILGGQEPKKGMFTYFQPVGGGWFRNFSDPVNSGWCCLGTGMENPARYTESTYWTDSKGITVGLYQPSVANWAEKGVTLRTQTRFPAESTVDITLTTDKPQNFAVRLRVPGWLAKPMEVRVNGQMISAKAENGYITVERSWKSGDRIHLDLPMSVHIETAQNDPTHVAILYGPVVLCGDLGSAGLESINFWGDNTGKPNTPAPKAPTLIADNFDALAARVKPVADKPLTFTLDLKDQSGPLITLRPYSEMFFCYYVAYWHSAMGAQERKRLEEEDAQRRQLDARTVAEVRPGEQQGDVDFKLKSERSNSGIGVEGRRWRDAKGWFSYEMQSRPNDPICLRVTYWSADQGRAFRILIDGTEIAREKLLEDLPARYVDKEYTVPVELTRGKSAITVRFQAEPNSTAGGVFGIRVLTAAPTASKELSH